MEISLETETAAGINNVKSERGATSKSYAQRQKEYRMRKKIQKQLHTPKKIPKTNAQYQKEFRQRQKEKLQQNEALDLARKKKNAERAKRYRDKLKSKRNCAELDTILSSAEDSSSIEIENETNYRHYTNYEELISRNSQMQQSINNESQQVMSPSVLSFKAPYEEHESVSSELYSTSSEGYQVNHDSGEKNQENEDVIKQEMHSQFNLGNLNKLILKMENESESLLNLLSTERPKDYYSNSTIIKLEDYKYEEEESSDNYNIQYKIDEENTVRVKIEDENIVEQCIDPYTPEEEKNVRVKIENEDFVEQFTDQYRTDEENTVNVKIEHEDIVEKLFPS